MNIKWYEFLRAARRFVWAYVVLLLVGLIGAGTYSLATAPQYLAVARAFVSTPSATNLSDLNQGVIVAQQIGKSYADVATTPYILDPVRKQLRLSAGTDQLATLINVSAPTDTSILVVTVRDASPSRSAAIANAVVQQLALRAGSLAASNATTGAAVKITPVQYATPPTRPDSPNVPVNLLLGALAGLLAAILVQLLSIQLDTRVRATTDLEHIIGRNVLGRVLRDRQTPQKPLVMHDVSRMREAEAYRNLRTSLQFLKVENRSAVLLTSSVESEGKSTTVSNLAVSLSDAGVKTLLIDADLRRPRLAEIFGVEGTSGLSNLLIGEISVASAIQQWGDGSLSLLPAGSIPPNPSELLASAKMAELLSNFQSQYEVVLIDAPPLLPVSDAAALASHIGGAVLVCALNRVTRGQINQSLQALSNVAVQLDGVIATMVVSEESGKYTYYSGFTRGAL